ncbi:MAG TPA: hypothetical protein VM778_03875 [Gemmatimonadota bacterium]|nr:hypothetical protein [Gemmatimonadota bacterium]
MSSIRIIRHGLLALTVVALAGCELDRSGPIGVQNDPVQPQLQTVEIDGVRLVLKPYTRRLVPATVSAVVIGSDGGSISADAGTLIVPAGALSLPETIVMEGSTTDIWKYLFGPAGLQFAAPATLEIVVDPSLMDGSDILLKVAGSDELGLEWEVIDGSYYDEGRGVVVAPIHHFSQYALCIE